ncbi:MAG: hypothetical protein WC601_03415 [Desulfotomaculaceae bacterium]
MQEALVIKEIVSFYRAKDLDFDIPLEFVYLTNQTGFNKFTIGYESLVNTTGVTYAAQNGKR